MKAVIFDMDGVLVNTEPLHFRCWKKVFGEEGIDLDYDVYKPRPMLPSDTRLMSFKVPVSGAGGV